MRLKSDNWGLAVLWPRLPQAFPENYEQTAAPLGELATVVSPVARWAKGLPVVTPSSVDRRTGAVVRTYPSRGRSALLVAKDCLMLGDILVAVTPHVPAILVREVHIGLAFSTRFLALRLDDRSDPTFLWAVLSSSSGLEARSRVGRGGSTPAAGAGDILAISVPVGPNSGRQNNFEFLLPQPAVDLGADSQPESSWSYVELSGFENWNSAIQRASAAESDTGIKLRDIAEVYSSKGIPVRDHLQAPLPGTVPIWRATDVTEGTFPRAWVASQAGVDVVEGDVLVTQIGPKHRIALAHRRGLLGSKVLLIRPREPGLGSDLAYFLSSPAGQQRLSLLETGSIIPTISLTAMRSLRTPWPLPRQQQEFHGVDRRPLSIKLEEALWT
jgi:hypothetical protein